MGSRESPERAEWSDAMPRRKTHAWNEIWLILEASGIPVDSTEARRWGAAYDSPLATMLLDLIDLIGETQGSRISAANVQRIGRAIGIAFEMGRLHDGRYCPPYEDPMAE
jgi:hypothetical protein